MSQRPRVPAAAWLIVPICAIGFLIWVNHVRIQRVEHVSALDGRVEAVDVADAGSLTGYAHEQRELIVPEHNNDTYHWIAQTQLMFARMDWRVRHVDYDNAPTGRAVHAPSVYRWWLGLVAWINHQATGQPIGLAVERAALYADPALQLVLLVGATLFAAVRLGSLSASLVAIGIAGLYPFAAGFLPGVPDHHGFVLATALASVLALLGGMGIARGAPETSPVDEGVKRRWFFCAGLIGGFGLWISVSIQGLILAGIALGALGAAIVARQAGGRGSGGSSCPPLPWRAWGLGGFLMTTLAYLCEYAPSHLELVRLEVAHPLWGLAWLGGSELLARATTWIQHGRSAWTRRNVALLILAAAAMAPVPVAWGLGHGRGLATADPMQARLTNLPDKIMASSFSTWFSRDGLSSPLMATLLCVVLLIPALWLMVKRTARPDIRIALAVALDPALVALGMAFARLHWWNVFAAVVLPIVAVMATAFRFAKAGDFRPRLWTGAVGLVALIGAVQHAPSPKSQPQNVLSVAEVRGLIERELAHWLAKRAAGSDPVVLAPPSLSTTLYFYGGLRGLGTFCWENSDGIAAAGRIASASSPDEALALIENREVTHIVIPTWDPFLTELARLGASNLENSFVTALNRWAHPRWLRPVPFQLPSIGGLEGQAVAVFEVVEEQSEVVAMSRLVDYFLEMGRLELAVAICETLKDYPADLNALVARSRTAKERNDAKEMAEVLKTIVPLVAGGVDRILPWDRRISLAVVLAQGNQLEMSRDQIRRCLVEVNESRLRVLSTASLLHLLVLGKAFNLEISDPGLRALAQDLLPAGLRDRVR
ncbi:MAG TPA: hypothetical protein VGA56_08045 [Opitutaceae bacterium]